MYDKLIQDMPVAYRKPVTVSLPPPLLKDVERLAKKQRQTTSELVRAALNRYLEDRKAEDALWKELRAYGAQRAKKLGVRTEADVQRIVDEYRRGNASRYATARRR
jgi:Arc/MetJ-type ribon-helix-helix transcriptional regulator